MLSGVKSFLCDRLGGGHIMCTLFCRHLKSFHRKLLVYTKILLPVIAGLKTAAYQWLEACQISGIAGKNNFELLK